MKSQLLPEGFRDKLPDLAEMEQNVNSFYLELMRVNGYRLVKPPLVEFENSLFFLKNDHENIDSFRIMDPLTQKIMGIRTDMTMQVARIACGSLAEKARPMRLCYTGEVLKVKNNNINLSRQFTQIGAEIIGVEENYSLNEIISLIIEILKKLKINKFIISFSIPDLIYIISKYFKLNKPNFETLINCYRNKNVNELINISQDLFQISEYLLGSIGKIEDKTDYIRNADFPLEIKNQINVFINEIENIKKEFNDHEIIIDPLEIDESNYHKGFCFKVYSEELKELFTGGGYKVYNENCVGFSSFLENLLTESEIMLKSNKKILVPKNIEDNIKRKIQDKDHLIVTNATKPLNIKQIEVEAKRQDCDFYYFNNKVFEVK